MEFLIEFLRNLSTPQVLALVVILALLISMLFLPKKGTAKVKEEPAKAGAKNQKKKSPLTEALVRAKIMSDPDNKPETTQDLLDVDHVFENGMTRLKDGTFTAIMELTQINQRLNNVDERSAIWKKFRNIVNAVNIRQTLLVQSHYLDINDYIRKYRESSEKVSNLTPQLEYFREDIIQNYEEFSEKKTREYRSYAIFRFNPLKEGMDKNLQTGNAVIDDLINAIKGTAETTKMSDEEAKDLASTILDEICDLSYSIYNSMGIRSVRLNRTGVYAMVYATLNRDLSGLQRITDASTSGAFTEFKETHTPYLVEEEMEEEIDEMLRRPVPSFMETAGEKAIAEETSVPVTETMSEQDEPQTEATGEIESMSTPYVENENIEADAQKGPDLITESSTEHVESNHVFAFSKQKPVEVETALEETALPTINESEEAEDLQAENKHESITFSFVAKSPKKNETKEIVEEDTALLASNETVEAPQHHEHSLKKDVQQEVAAVQEQAEVFSFHSEKPEITADTMKEDKSEKVQEAGPSVIGSHNGGDMLANLINMTKR